MNGRDARFPQVSALNGLRGTAILIVIFYHMRVLQWHGSFIVVDLFFLLSGFVVTAHLVREFDTRGKIDIPHFYVRRLLRLLPAMIAITLVFGVVGILLHLRTLPEILTDAGPMLLFFSNWSRAFDWYPPLLFGHSWSLSEEMQFYILWPFLLIPLLRLRSRMSAISVLLVLTVLSWIYRTYMVLAGASVMRLFNGFDTRVDAFLIGGACGLLASSLLLEGGRLPFFKRILRFCLIPSIVLFFTLIVYGDWHVTTMYIWILPVANVCSAIVVLNLYVFPQGKLSMIFSKPLLLGLSRISYGLYLWHYPIVSGLIALGYSPFFVIVGSGGMSLVMAICSFVLVERPCLQLQERFRSSFRRSEHNAFSGTPPVSVS